MPRFDVGLEGKLRVNGVEAPSGEAARDEVLRRFKEFIVKLDRNWFQPSADQTKSDS